MSRYATDNSVGIVTPQTFEGPGPLTLRSGSTLASYTLTYETYGELNADRSNALLICHALSGHHHAAGRHASDDAKPGWWDNCIGPGKPIDTNRYFVISLNNIGGCHGSTGPSSIDPATGAPYGPDFPIVTVPDWVHTQAQLADHLGIERFAAVVGGSLGGMQALQWSVAYPERVANAVIIAAAPKLSAQNIAFNEIARHAITSDPDFHNGRYRESEANPDLGLALARMIGHVTYLSDSGMGSRFGRELKSGDLELAQDVEFQVESYLQYQGRNFSKAFDANTYVLMTRALDYFDPAHDHDGHLPSALEPATARFLVLSFSTDWRFSPSRSEEIVDALIAARRDVSYACVESQHGHDSFLLPLDRYFDVLGDFLARAHDDIERGAEGTRGAS